MAEHSNGSRSRSSHRLDSLDEEILWELVRDARISNKALAQTLHVSQSTALTRVRALKEAGVLESTHAKLNHAAIGLHVEALIFVTLAPRTHDQIDRFSAFAINLAHAVNVFFVSGDDDFIVHVACASTEQLRNLVVSIGSDAAVARTRTHLVFEHLDGAQHMDHVDGFSELRAPID